MYEVHYEHLYKQTYAQIQRKGNNGTGEGVGGIRYRIRTSAINRVARCCGLKGKKEASTPRPAYVSGDRQDNDLEFYRTKMEQFGQKRSKNPAFQL